MNIVQIHEAVRFWLDTVRSPRQDSIEIDRAINLTIDSLVNEKYEQATALHPNDAFQKTQKVRDQLGKLVERLTVANGKVTIAAPAIPGESVITYTNPDSFRHLLSVVVFTPTSRYPCFPIDYNHKTVVQRNPFRRPRIGKYSKFYHTEEEGKTLILHPETIVLSEAELFVLRDFISCVYGFEADQTKSFGAGEQVIVAKKGTVYAGVEKNIGDVITIVAPNLAIDSGLVVYDFVNCELSVTLHEEIARRTAVQILRSTSQVEKVNMLMAEFKVGRS